VKGKARKEINHKKGKCQHQHCTRRLCGHLDEEYGPKDPESPTAQPPVSLRAGGTPNRNKSRTGKKSFAFWTARPGGNICRGGGGDENLFPGKKLIRANPFIERNLRPCF